MHWCMIEWKAGITTWREEKNLDEKVKKIFAVNAVKSYISISVQK